MTVELNDLGDHELETLRIVLRREQLQRSGERWHDCLVCEVRFVGRADATFCSGRCRTAAYRRRKAQRE